MPIMENLNFGTNTPLYPNPIPMKNIIHLRPNSNTTAALWHHCRACSCAVCWSCCSWSCFFKPRFGPMGDLNCLMGRGQKKQQKCGLLMTKKKRDTTEVWPTWGMWAFHQSRPATNTSTLTLIWSTEIGIQPIQIGFNQHLRPQRAFSWRCDCCARWCPQSYNLVNHIN